VVNRCPGSGYWDCNLFLLCNRHTDPIFFSSIYFVNTGSPSEENCYADIDAAYEHLITFRETDPRQIVLYGRSVGSGPATFLASKLATEGEELGGLILECPFKSVLRVVADVGCTMMNDRFPNIDRISSVR
jgi:hypothetical protein